MVDRQFLETPQGSRQSSENGKPAYHCVKHLEWPYPATAHQAQDLPAWTSLSVFSNCDWVVFKQRFKQLQRIAHH